MRTTGVGRNRFLLVFFEASRFLPAALTPPRRITATSGFEAEKKKGKLMNFIGFPQGHIEFYLFWPGVPKEIQWIPSIFPIGFERALQQNIQILFANIRWPVSLSSLATLHAYMGALYSSLDKSANVIA